MEWPPPPRSKPLELALPASILATEPTLELKTLKVGVVGRTAAVFRVTALHIYVDRPEGWKDAELAKLLLEYMLTAPYLRKLVFKERPELRYAGLLPPLQLPTHGVGGPKVGEVREALVLRRSGQVAIVEAGLGGEVEVRLPRGAQVRRGDRILVRVESLEPPRLGYVDPSKPPVYSGFKVRLWEDGLRRLLVHGRDSGMLIVATSRLGELYPDVRGDLVGAASGRSGVLVVVGAPDRGLREIAEEEGFKLADYVDFIVNTVPGQGTVTVRSEEAAAATLALLNVDLPA